VLWGLKQLKEEMFLVKNDFMQFPERLYTLIHTSPDVLFMFNRRFNV